MAIYLSHDSDKKIMMLAQALELSDEARVICSAVYPYIVLYTNKAWTIATQYEQHEVAGKNLNILHGELTDVNAIAQMMHNVRFTGFGEAKVINYTKSGVAFSNDISIQPLVSSDIYGANQVTHLLGTVIVSPVDPKIKSRISRLSAQQIRDYNWISSHVVSCENSITSSNSNGSTDSASNSTTSNPSTINMHPHMTSKTDHKIDNNDNVDTNITTFERKK